MTYHQKLDIVLKFIAKHNVKYYSLVRDFQVKPISEFELPILLEFLVKEKKISFIEVKSERWAPTFQDYELNHRITLEGILFLERTSYVKQLQEEKRKKAWEITKIIAITINALAILLFSYLQITK